MADNEATGRKVALVQRVVGTELSQLGARVQGMDATMDVYGSKLERLDEASEEAQQEQAAARGRTEAVERNVRQLQSSVRLLTEIVCSLMAATPMGASCNRGDPELLKETLQRLGEQVDEQLQEAQVLLASTAAAGPASGSMPAPARTTSTRATSPFDEDALARLSTPDAFEVASAVKASKSVDAALAAARQALEGTGAASSQLGELVAKAVTQVEVASRASSRRGSAADD